MTIILYHIYLVCPLRVILCYYTIYHKYDIMIYDILYVCPYTCVYKQLLLDSLTSFCCSIGNELPFSLAIRETAFTNEDCIHVKITLRF